jgi:hypothetical protein
MFCPQCGTTQSDELKFCKACGANLSAVRQAVTLREPPSNFDWSKTWVAEMFMSGEEAKRRKAEAERLQGITPEVKRYNEIKGGVITASVGLAAMIFLYVFMQGVVLSGNVPPHEVEIVSRIWIAGIVPFFVGLAIIFNGVVLGKKQVELAKRAREAEAGALDGPAAAGQLRPADTTEFIPSNFSVTEETTKHLSSPAQKQ